MNICICLLTNTDYYDSIDYRNSPDKGGLYESIRKWNKSNGDYLFIFDLQSSEMYERKIDETSGKPKTSRTPIFPAEWKNQFGLPVEEHKKQLQIDLFNGFAIFGLEDKKNTNTDINNFEGNNNE